jgi:hypothetical protein
MLRVRKASLAGTGSCLVAAVIFGGFATPAHALEEHPSNSTAAVGDATARTGATVAAADNGGQPSRDVARTVSPDPRMEAVLSFVTECDDNAYLDFSAAKASGIDLVYLNEFADAFERLGGIVKRPLV